MVEGGIVRGESGRPSRVNYHSQGTFLKPEN
jgi:hypothetical protein